MPKSKQHSSSKHRSAKRNRNPPKRFPGQYTSNPTFQRKFRFECTNSESKGADVVYSYSLSNLCYIATGSTTAVTMFSAVRLRQIEIWGPPNPSSWQTMALEWTGAKVPNKVITATGDNVVPPHIKSRPPSGSYAAMWINRSQDPPSYVANSALFALSGYAQCIIEVTLQFQLLDYDAVQSQASLTTTGGTSGLIFVNALDNTSSSGGAGTHNWNPLGFSSFGVAYG